MKEIKTYSASLSNLDRMTADIEEFCEKNSVSGADCFDITLCLDEIFTNIVSYGYRGNDSKKIELWLQKSGNKLNITMRDNAPEFNPLEDSPAPDLTKPIEERNVGGLGVHFLKSKMHGLKYTRRDGVNELCMTKLLGKDAK